jgi:hypothetical protein
VSQFLRYPYDSVLPALYFGQNVSAGALNTYLPNYIDSFVVISQLNQYATDSATDPLREDLRLNDVYAWVPQAPVQMTYCTEDEQVDSESTLFTYNYFITHGDLTATKLDGGPYTHENCVDPAILNMLTLFTNMKVNRNNLVATFVVDSATTPGGNNAGITVQVTGGTAYTFNWSNGDTTASITNLNDGNYIVTITDSKGCPQVDTVNTTVQTTGIAPLCCAPQPQVSIFPNPAGNGFLHVIISGFVPNAMVVYDVAGKQVINNTLAGNSVSQIYNQQINISTLSAGVYIVEVKSAGVTARTRFVKL